MRSSTRRYSVVGWSHGGLIGLFCIFDHPADYRACFAGVPVSDVIARMGYKDDEYRDLFSAPYHIGKTADEIWQNPEAITSLADRPLPQHPASHPHQYQR
ncbi:MAG: prolyl oligopeptidase family serine peptidase [Bacteroidales bacterium]|nr:prolyl oligopeptidase family serine peptidase [Bacteroidales bacterium]